MTWTALLALSAISYCLKAVGPVFAGGRQLGARLRLTLDLVAVPLLAALICVQTAGVGRRLRRVGGQHHENGDQHGRTLRIMGRLIV